MKTYKTAGAVTFQALQYGVDPEAKKHVRKCYKNYSGKIVAVPGDMLGVPRDAFDGVVTAAGCRKVEDTDYIIVDGDQVHLVSAEFFKFMNVEAVA